VSTTNAPPADDTCGYLDDLAGHESTLEAARRLAKGLRSCPLGHTVMAMGPGPRPHQGVNSMVRLEGDRQMTSPGAPVRQPLQSRPEGGSASTVVVEHNTVTSTSRPYAVTRCESTSRSLLAEPTRLRLPV
jgi:hypothetical protein